MGDVAVHDGPEPLDGIEMRAIGRQLDHGVCQRCCPPISCGVSDLRDADFIFWVEPDRSGGLPVSGFAPVHLHIDWHD